MCLIEVHYTNTQKKYGNFHDNVYGHESSFSCWCFRFRLHFHEKLSFHFSFVYVSSLVPMYQSRGALGVQLYLAFLGDPKGTKGCHLL